VSVTGKRGAGIPIILLHDATGGTVTVELKNGCLYRGTLEDVQDNMNCTIKVKHIILIDSSSLAQNSFYPSVNVRIAYG
jgi:small nuclear ribonucleoprotein (snRNP)-like protein